MKNLFCERLKELRREKNLLQSELAEKLHVCKSAVSGWEVGRNQPNYDLLIEIAEFFEVSIDYILGRTNFWTKKQKNFKENKQYKFK